MKNNNPRNPGLDLKLQRHYKEDRIAASNLKIASSFLVMGELDREDSSKLKDRIDDYTGTLEDGPLKTEFEEKSESIQTGIDKSRKNDVADVAQALDYREESAKKASKFYNRPWNKGRIQEMAAQDAANQGVVIEGPFNRPSTQEVASSLPEPIEVKPQV